MKILLFLFLLFPASIHAQQKAYSPVGNYLESLDTNHFKVYYISTDTIELWVVDGVVTSKNPFPFPKNIIVVKQAYMKESDAIMYYGIKGRHGAMLIQTKKK